MRLYFARNWAQPEWSLVSEHTFRVMRDTINQIGKVSNWPKKKDHQIAFVDVKASVPGHCYRCGGEQFDRGFGLAQFCANCGETLGVNL